MRTLSRHCSWNNTSRQRSESFGADSDEIADESWLETTLLRAVVPLGADGDEVADESWLGTTFPQWIRWALTVTKLLMNLGWKQHFRAMEPLCADSDEIADESWLETTLLRAVEPLGADGDHVADGSWLETIFLFRNGTVGRRR